MSKLQRTATAAAAVLAIFGILLLVHVAHVMFLPHLQGGTYGISFGTDTHFCFANVIGHGFHGAHFDARCQVAQ
jgi:hypothetical protein